jgi:galactose mutarotase-like enzyme
MLKGKIGMTCKVTEVILGKSMNALEIENDILAMTILLDKGADIYRWIYKPKDIDVLWKSPWGMKEPSHGFDSAFDSSTAWLEAYAGGWQVLFPNGGDPNTYKGASLGFHGEASMKAWEYETVSASEESVEIKLSTRLFRSPYSIERWMKVETGSPILHIRERITNHAGEPMDCMWSHHPAYGAPFLSEHCVIDIGTKTFVADDLYAGTVNPLILNQQYDWPMAGNVDMSKVPDEDTPRDTLAYFQDFESGWYSITNTQLGMGLGLSWDTSVFPYAWFWQELNASAGFPFYKNSYVMAIEPASSIPGQGLTNVIEKSGNQLTLQAGEYKEVEMKAVFYESNSGVQNIDSDGNVKLK